MILQIITDIGFGYCPQTAINEKKSELKKMEKKILVEESIVFIQDNLKFENFIEPDIDFNKCSTVEETFYSLNINFDNSFNFSNFFKKKITIDYILNIIKSIIKKNEAFSSNIKVCQKNNQIIISYEEEAKLKMHNKIQDF